MGKLRDLLNANPTIMTALAVLLTLAALAYVVSRRHTSSLRIVHAYFYDLNDDKPFIGPSNALAPIRAPSDERAEAPPDTLSGVRAHVFSCTGCDDDETHFIGWLEKYTPEARQLLLNPPDDSDDAISAKGPAELAAEGRQVRAVEGGPWVPAASAEGIEIQRQARARCPAGQRAKPCRP